MRFRSSPTTLRSLLSALLLLAMFSAMASAQCLRISKVDVTNNRVELTNVDVSAQAGGYWLCNFPSYIQIAQAVSGGETVSIDLPAGFLTAGDGEVGLYSTNSFASAAAMMDYMQYGSGNHTRASVADAAGIWSASDFVPLPQSGAVEWNGTLCGDPGDSSRWLGVVATESQSFASVKSLYQ